MLTRSLSSGALHTLRRRSGSICSQALSINEVRRTISNSTLPSPMIKTPCSDFATPKLERDTLDEFINFVESRGDNTESQEYHNQMIKLWNTLPESTRDVFVRRAIVKRGHRDDLIKTSHGNGFIQYRQKVGPILRNEAKLDEVTVSKIVGRVYNEVLSDEEKFELREEARMDRDSKYYEQWKKIDEYLKGPITDPVLEELTFVKNNKKHKKKYGRVDRVKRIINKLGKLYSKINGNGKNNEKLSVQLSH